MTPELPRVLPRPPRAGHRRPGLHRQQSRAPARRARRRRPDRRLAASRTTAATSSTSTGIARPVRVNIADVRDETVDGRRWSRIATSSSTSPARSATSTACAIRYTDLDINCRAQLSMLEACRRHNPGGQGRLRRHAPGLRPAGPAAGRRAASGAARPTSTASTRRPASTTTCSTTTCSASAPASLRLTNVYGPRQLIKHNRQGFIGWFIRLAIEGREIQIFGDGSQLRDFVYVDDAADAFLRAGGDRRVRRRGVQRRRRSSRSATASWSRC